ncbi:signal peptidase I [Arenicella xantha]|uniref:Signal peptidase I n=1 Tax=Arenicella xantha TaxID=644221 RepID=A0A395JGT5_9GAMM|nr:signal peptidase I [Arenicella xantha]RBP48941.1 signal peptidase I [Arenicella xantha]
MKRFLLGMLMVVGVAALGLYVFNPSGTPSLDPRARIFGHIPYRLPATSMEPTLLAGDYIVSSTFAYIKQSPQHGDIITFRYPRDPKQVYIKRVIGLPGDMIEVRGHQVFRNDIALDEPYVQHTHEREPAGKWQVPDSMYFVLGDNRDNSADSRVWGFLPQGLVEGKAIYVWVSKQGNTGSINAGVPR